LTSSAAATCKPQAKAGISGPYPNWYDNMFDASTYGLPYGPWHGDPIGDFMNVTPPNTVKNRGAWDRSVG
jgi:hypothetical protein